LGQQPTIAALFAVLLCWSARAQPVCSIQLGADTTICQGGTATLLGPPGYTNYLWSTGAQTQNISAGAAGPYWCEVSYPSGNLVYNGNFSSGNTGFTSQFIYSTTSVQNEGYYAVGTDANDFHNQFQGTGSGNFLIANAGWVSWNNGQFDLWCQTIPCCPGQTYTMSFIGRTLTNNLPARLVWMMDGQLAQWPDFTMPAYNAGWQTFTTTWTAGPGQTSVNACLRVTSGNGVGDDFGIDNISISSMVTLRDTVQVAVTPLPVVDLGPNQTLCAGDVTTLDATVPGGTYVWQNGSTASTFQVTSPGHYSVTVTAQNCSSSDFVNISYNPLPTVDLGPDTVLCTGSTLVLNAFSPGYSYLWQNGSTASSFVVAQAGTYWVEVTRNNCSMRDSILVGYKPMPTVFLGNDTTICAGSTVVLDATVPGATCLWENGSTSPVRPVTATGTYQVSVDLNGCVSQDGILVTVNPLPVVNLGADQTVCPGTVVTFDATITGASYLWNGGSTSGTLTTQQPGTYSVQVTTGGCSATDTVALALFNLQAVDLGPDRTICAGSSARLGVQVPGATYLWNTGAATDSITVTTGGTYWVETVLNGCTVSDTIQVALVPLPPASLGPDQQICPGNSILLDAAASNATYLWNNGATSPSISVGPGNWSVVVTVNGCSASDAVSITAYAPPVVDLGPDTVLCPGETILLDGGPAGTYQWSTGATGATIVVSSPTNASVTVTDGHGCQASDQVNIGYAQPGAVNLGQDTGFCAGGQLLLDATTAGATAYLWNDGSTNAVLLTSVAGSYAVQVTIGQCSVADTILVASWPLPVVNLGNDTVLCPGESLLLQPPSAGLALAWQDGSTGNSFLVNSPGTYTVAATNSYGCTAADALQVNFHTIGPLSLGPDTTICSGGSLLLNASLPGGSTQWSGASQAVSSVITASTAGMYIATTTVAGCALSDTIVLTVVPTPNAVLGPDTSLCAGSTLLLSTTGPAPLWDDGTSGAQRLITQGGTYWLQLSTGGCTGTDSITVVDLPVPSVQLPADTGLCPAQTLAVDVTVPGGSYLWNDGNTAAQRLLPPGTWQVVVWANTCSATDSIEILALPAPVLDLPADTTLCSGELWTIDASQPNSTYLWNTGSTASSITVGTSGVYTVAVDRQGCTASASVNVAVLDLSTFSLGADTLLCPGEQLLLNVTVAGATVTWQNGSTGPQFIVTAAGTYQATVDAAGCTASSSIDVNFSTIPAAALGPDQQLCAGDSLLLAVDAGTALAVWNDGSTEGSLLATTTGIYTVLLAQDGCLSADTVSLVFNPVQDQLSVAPDGEICFGQTILLDASTPGATYAWNNGSSMPNLVVDQPGTYSVTIIGPCIHAVDTIRIMEGSCAPMVHIPNAFTPNNDGHNDLFLAVASEPVDQWTLKVFDQWGLEVFSSNNAGDGWDGTCGGREAPMGVYVWDLHYRKAATGGVVQVRERGSVTLVR